MIIVYLLIGALVIYIFYWLLAGHSDSEGKDRPESGKRGAPGETLFPQDQDASGSSPGDASDEERRRAAIKNIMNKRAETGNIEPSDAAKVVSQWMNKPLKKKK